jgi:hypothetical protein
MELGRYVYDKMEIISRQYTDVLGEMNERFLELNQESG